MDKRKSSQSQASQWQMDRASFAMQRVAETMIATTESFRRYFRGQYGYTTEPQPLPCVHTRPSSSSSAGSSNGLVVDHPATTPREGDASMLGADNRMPSALRLSRRTYDGPRSDGIPPLPELPGSTPLGLYRISNRGLPEHVATTLNLSSPNLPPRLQTPMTPMDWSAPTPLNQGEPRPPTPRAELPASSGSGPEETAGHGDYFAPRGYEYAPLEPDCTPESCTRGSPMHAQISNDLRRKPVPPPCKPSPPESTTSTNKALVVVVVCVAHALAAAGFAQALLPAGVIRKSISSTIPGQLAWYSAAYTLGAGAFSLPASRAAEVFGHKGVFVSGLFWLAAWSLLASLSVYVHGGGNTATAYFCFCRAMQGIAAALVVPNGHFILCRTYPLGVKDDLVMSLFGASAPLGFVLGAIMAGLFAHSTSWPGGFYFLMGVSLVLAGISIFILPPEVIESARSADESIWVRLDIAGTVLGVSGLVLFNVGWNQVSTASWHTPYTYFLIIIGAIIFAAFIYLESKATYPLIATRALTATAYAVLGLVAVCWASFSIWLFYLVQFLQHLRNCTALLTGAALVPLVVGGITASFATSYFLEERPRARWLMFASAATLFIGSVFMAMAPKEQTYWLNTFFSILIVSLGIVMANPAAVVLLGDSMTADARQGVPASLTFAVSMCAMSTAVGMAGAVDRTAQGPEGNALSGYRGAQYLGLGLGALGLVVASVLLVIGYLRRLRKDQEMGG